MSNRGELHVVARFELEGGVELEGTAEALARLAASLRQVDSCTTHSLTIPGDQDAAPYDGFLSQLCLESIPGPLRIHRDGGTLRLRGSAQALATLAQNIEFLVAPSGGAGRVHGDHQHVHVEYYDDHPFLAKEAEPLTIVLA
jgi:hypothetical protein